MTSLGTMRYLFFGVGLVGGVILLAAGETLLGGVLVAMATARIGLLVSMQHRMRSSSQTRSMNDRPGNGRQMLQRLASMELDVAATTIGIAPDVLRRAVNDGHSISAVAADAGVPSDRVVDAVVRDATRRSIGPSPTAAWPPTGPACFAIGCRTGPINWWCKHRGCSPAPHRVPADVTALFGEISESTPASQLPNVAAAP